MGVQGWNWLLQKEGYLPARSDAKCCSCSLWRDESAMKSSAFASRTTVVPKGSELHVDGNGLAFVLHRVAYARHMAQVLVEGTGKQSGKHSSLNNYSKSPCTIRKKLSTLSSSQARRLLPNFMPMELLSDVTREFLSQLKDKHQMHLKVYWDGDCRRVFKAATDEKRQERLPEEWSNLQLYCTNGILPSVAKACELESLFPKCRFFQREISETLLQCGVPQIECNEEADGAIAQAASGNPNAYVLGEDSDFCFFPNVNYIPMSTLDASQSQLATAIVLRRDELAQDFDLPDEAAMVELAILMGNDYVSAKTSSFDNYEAGEWESAVDFVKEQGAGFRVTSKSEETEAALLFVRALYQLESLDQFELYDHRNQSNAADDDDGSEAAGDVIIDDPINGSSSGQKAYRPSVPSQMPVELLAIDLRMDRSLKDAVQRCLQAYVNMMETMQSRDDAMLTQTHLDVFQNMPTPINSKASDTKKDWRPRWSDIPAAYLIEKMLAEALEQKSPMAHAMRPSAIFNQLLFLEKMNDLHEKLEIQESEHKDDQEQVFSPPEGKFDMGERQRLPIDDHEEMILESIAKNRVTIIQGETGCGKSSRIPVMVLNAPPPDPALSAVKMYISQPRRIAAKGLVERVRSVEPDLGKLFALRLGHGLREYESEETRAWFCTTGYLVRLLANHTEGFNDVSHLIIDEIHDRGVDLDLLCLLCRRLLRVNQHLRLILMSATLAAALFQEYFDVSDPPIQVGARRFPVTEIFLEDMVSKNGLSLPESARKTARQLIAECDRLQFKYPPNAQYLEKLGSLATKIIASIGKGGTSILVFVPGMNEIIAIVEQIGDLFIPGLRFTTIPVHSELPFEDQLAVFSQTNLDECRVIVATNSAESSVTLPALDHVIDLGLCRQIVYNNVSHRQLLTLAWIPRASATQRAGRTGRIRKGNVYRLYTHACFKDHMQLFEPGEMVRIPLDTVLLTLKGILPPEESATQILLECLEPPNVSTIERSLASLHDSRFITSPDDDGEITKLGSFVSALGTDLLIGALIGLGIQFGVGPEAIQLAGALSFGTKPPWIMSNLLLHGVQEFNSVSAETFVSRCHFGSNLFSEPFAIMNLVWAFKEAAGSPGWCWKYRVSVQRIKQLASSCSNLQRRVADLFNLRTEFLDMESPPLTMPAAKLTILRAIQVWVFHETMIEWNPKDAPKRGERGNPEFSISILSKSDGITANHFDGILMKDRHPFDLRIIKSVEQMGLVLPMQKVDESFDGVSNGFTERLISYAIENQFSIVCFRTKKVFVGFVSTQVQVSEVNTVEQLFSNRLQLLGAVAGKEVSGKARGISERACGKWKLVGLEGNHEGLPTFRMYALTSLGSAKQVRSLDQDLCRILEDCKPKSAYFRLTMQKTKRSESYSFAATLNGNRVEAISPRDMKDLFASLEEVKPDTKVIVRRQELIFPLIEAGPWNPGEKKIGATDGHWPQPLVECIPEGARIIHALASSSRRGAVVWLGPINEGEEEDDGEEKLLAMHIDPYGFGEWKKFPEKSMVYLPDLSVPAMAVPLDGKTPLQCCCANALDIRGGAMKVEGLTMLPPGRAFSFLCRICFGIEQIPEDGTLDFSGMGPDGGPLSEHQEGELLERCLKAESLNTRSQELGEELVCDTSFVVDLLDVFDGFQSGEELQPWANLEDNPFTKENLRKGRDRNRSAPPATTRNYRQHNDETIANKKTSNRAMQRSGSDPVGGPTNRASMQPAGKAARQKRNTSTLNVQHTTRNQQNASNSSRIVKCDPEQIALPSSIPKLFVTDLEENREISADELPSPNILALVLEIFSKQKNKAGMKFGGPNANWTLHRIMVGPSAYFQAQFEARDKSPLVDKEVDGDLPEWIKQRAKPTALMDILECVPASFSLNLFNGSFEGNAGVFFNSIDTAIRIECAIWLEGQFRVGPRHWYQMTIEEMVGRLRREIKMRSSSNAKKPVGSKKKQPKRSATS
ncbi:hypothetical protein ACA910_013970 [Epithemia clementina (nom. ined.)]